MIRDKQDIRERVWQALKEARVARFPGARGRIPNFTGAERAAERLSELDVWKRAKVLKCNPDSPQRPVRLRALKEGKIVYMAVPRLRQRKCFWELDPRRLQDLSEAATIGGAAKLGRPIDPRQLPHIDLVVAGSVAVSKSGARVGKGGGYSDLEYAIGRALGRIDRSTVVATTVHELQVLKRELPMTRHDLYVDLIATPERVIRVPRGGHRQPSAVLADELRPDQWEEIPILKALGL